MTEQCIGVLGVGRGISIGADDGLTLEHPAGPDTSLRVAGELMEQTAGFAQVLRQPEYLTVAIELGDERRRSLGRG